MMTFRQIALVLIFAGVLNTPARAHGEQPAMETIAGMLRGSWVVTEVICRTCATDQTQAAGTILHLEFPQVKNPLGGSCSAGGVRELRRLPWRTLASQMGLDRQNAARFETATWVVFGVITCDGVLSMRLAILSSERLILDFDSGQFLLLRRP